MVVVLDAAGTLLEVDGGVGEAYAAEARRSGAELDPARIEGGFARALAEAPPLAFGVRPGRERRADERAWWRAVACRALEAAGPLPERFDFARFFDLAFERFARPGTWRVFEDVRPGLRAARRAGLPLVVFSNWDGRLRGLLDELGLGGFFARVHVSSEMAAAKPDPAAFEEVGEAIADLVGGAPPVMVGDRLDHDVEAALAAGWRAVWLDRAGRSGPLPAGAARIDDLRALPGALASEPLEIGR